MSKEASMFYCLGSLTLILCLIRTYVTEAPPNVAKSALATAIIDGVLIVIALKGKAH